MLALKMYGSWQHHSVFSLFKTEVDVKTAIKITCWSCLHCLSIIMNNWKIYSYCYIQKNSASKQDRILYIIIIIVEQPAWHSIKLRGFAWTPVLNWEESLSADEVPSSCSWMRWLLWWLSRVLPSCGRGRYELISSSLLSERLHQSLFPQCTEWGEMFELLIEPKGQNAVLRRDAAVWRRCFSMNVNSCLLP